MALPGLVWPGLGHPSEFQCPSPQMWSIYICLELMYKAVCQDKNPPGSL